jgi:uncharacterized protein (DUF111 family)
MLTKKQKERIENQIVCEKLLDQIKRGADLGKAPLTAAKMLDFLFLSVIPDKRTREQKLRLLFRAKFTFGDDVYLRIIVDYQKNAARISRKITEKYREEIKLIKTIKRK